MVLPVLCNLRAYGQWWVSPKGHWFKPLRQEGGPVPDVTRTDSPPQAYTSILDGKMPDHLHKEWLQMETGIRVLSSHSSGLHGACF